MRRLPLLLALTALSLWHIPALADSHVAIVAQAADSYSGRKFADGKPAIETFVYMQGRYYPGAVVDRSLDKMSFRELVSYLTPRLGERQFIPAKKVQDADLLLVIDWGMTNPRIGILEMTGNVTTDPGAVANMEQIRQHEATSGMGSDDPDFEQRPSGALPGLDEMFFDNLERVGDSIARDGNQRDLAQLLGYTKALRKMTRSSVFTAEEATLRFDLTHERYFVIIRAYDLRQSLQTKKPKLAWTVHMNISSPGNNFRTAMTRMSFVGPQFFGTTTENVESVRAGTRLRDVKVDLGDLIILGEAK